MLQLIKLLVSGIAGLLTKAVTLVTSKEALKQLPHISLYSNAFYLMTANAGGALLGLAFWVIVARFYSAEDVGVASAVIAAATMMTSFCSLGLGMGLIRFLPHSKNASSLINTVFTIGLLTSIVAAFIFVAGVDFWSPALLFLKHNSIYLATFVLCVIAYTLAYFADLAFIAERRAGFVLAKGIITGSLRLAIVIPLAVFAHSLGIFASWGVSLGVAFLVSIFLFLPRAEVGYRPSFAFNRQAVNNMLRFSFANYIGRFIQGAPNFIFPIMVINLLGAEPTAYFYIAWTVSHAVTMISTAVSTALFAEGSYEEERLGVNIWRSIKMVYLILVPGVILMLAIADKLLLLFGISYSENATILLRILAISALFLPINRIYLAIKRVEKKLKVIVGLPTLFAVVTLGLAYLFLPKMGINGVGVAWLAGQGIIALVIIAISLKRRRVFSQISTYISKT